MTRTGRALLGAMMGAVVTLFAHPASRPYLLGAFVSPSNPAPPPAETAIPKELPELAAWMTAIGERSLSNNRLSPLGLKNSIAAAAEAAKLDPDNAYWHQMLACLYHQAGQETDARHQWLTSSACANWNDYQSKNLVDLRDELAKDFGGDQSWQLAYVYYQRSDKAALLISLYSGSLLPGASLSSRDGLALRAASVLNGSLLRLGSRSIRVGVIGAKLSEEACHPPGLKLSQRTSKLFLQRIALHNKLKDSGQTALADQVNLSYRETDGWDALLSEEDAADVASQCSWLSLLYFGFPSMLPVIAIVGLLFWVVGHLLRKVERIGPAAAIATGLVFGIAAYFVTYLPLAALATFLCCASIALGPKRERRIKADDLGPMFGFTAGTLGVAFMILFGAFVVGTTSPAVSLLPWLGVPHEYFGGSAVLMGLSIIVTAILLLIAPLFATALRVGTGFVLSMALRRFGAFLACISLALIVVATPICIYLDRNNGDTLQRLVLNEPVYYLSLPR